MLQYTDTTVFNVGAQTIVNTVNCVGVMGTGLALEFQLRFPDMNEDYISRCKDKKVEVGRPYLYKKYDSPWILNFPTKNHWKYPAKIEWIEQGLNYFSENYKRGNISSIAFPKLGCSNGGLDWSIVSPLMKKYLNNLDLDVFICEDTEREASGVEGLMVQMLNNLDTMSWSESINIRLELKKRIVDSAPIYRFRDLRKVEGIGKQTYNDLFRLLYALATQRDPEDLEEKKSAKNLSLFAETETISVDLIEGKFGSRKVESENKLKKIEFIPEYDNLFEIILPSLEKALSIAQTLDEVVTGFNQVVKEFKISKKMVGDWLKEAEKRGKIEKISRRPVKYIAVSSPTTKQLEFKV